MSEQIIILISIFLVTVMTLFLYVWKAKKEVEYKKDERWQVIQNKANVIANLANVILVLILAILVSVTIFSTMNPSIRLNRVILYGLLFIGFRNILELIALQFYDKSM